MRDLHATNMKAKLKSRLPNDSYRVVTYSYSLILRLFGSLTPKLWKKNSPLNSFSQSLSTNHFVVTDSRDKNASIFGLGILNPQSPLNEGTQKSLDD